MLILSGRYWKYKSSLGLIGTKVVIGVAAIWDKRKGLTDIITISKRSDAKYIFVGLSEEQKKRMPNNVIPYTRTENIEALRKLYAVSDVFINPTYEDNYPTTNIEAIACGTPVVSYNSGGSCESANIYGTTIEKGNLSELETGINNKTLLNLLRNEINFDEIHNQTTVYKYA